MRAGDFFGPQARNNWFSQGLVKPGRPVSRISNPGIGVGHQWAYLPGEMLEMRYLWQRPVRMDNGKLKAVLGDEQHTPLELAVEETLAALGCLPVTTAAVHAG